MQTGWQTDGPVPVPGTRSQKNVHPAEGGALRESPRGAQARTEPAAARRHEEHRASRRGMFTQDGLERTQVFRLLCALVRAELRAHPELNFRDGYANTVEHLKCAAARANLPYGHDRLQRAITAIERTERARTPKAPPAPPRVHWRDRCAALGHQPRCETPVRCELRTMRGGR